MTPDQIKEARIKAGLTTEQAARICYVHHRTWWRWELGESVIPRAAWELFTLRTGDLSTNQENDHE